jgi:ribosomal protein S27AE
MSNRYKVRAYCGSRICDYVHKEDVMVAINYETAYSLAQLYNEFPSKPNCPSCGEPIVLYAHSVIVEPWIT